MGDDVAVIFNREVKHPKRSTVSMMIMHMIHGFDEKVKMSFSTRGKMRVVSRLTTITPRQVTFVHVEVNGESRISILTNLKLFIQTVNFVVIAFEIKKQAVA